MNLLFLKINRFLKKIFRKREKWSVDSYIKKIETQVPLGRWSSHLLFGNHVQEIEEKFKKNRPISISDEEKIIIKSNYNHVFQSHGKRILYAFIPASHQSMGLVVSFHPWNGNQYFDHLKPLSCFDVLAPFDNFGSQQWSCGFWGLDGDPFLVNPIQELIQKICQERNYSNWFTIGGSLGGFAALYHGILGQCDGMYVMTPQVDIRVMSESDLRRGYKDDVYSAMISSTDPKKDPSILKIAQVQETLPPLFLIQSLYDTINPYASHAYLLQKVYHEKRGWYGLRIHPSIGHRADGSQKEAEYFFLNILKKNPHKMYLDF